MTATEVSGRFALSAHGVDSAGRVFRNPTTALLYSHALLRGDGRLAEGGPLAVDTGVHTGRSPKDKFVVREPGSEKRIWWGEVNAELSEAHFAGLRNKVTERLGEAAVLYVVDAWAGADPGHRLGVRVVTAHPYHALFAKTMFIDLAADELAGFAPDALVLHTPELEADPDADGTRSGTFVVLHPGRTELLVGGTFYAGEIKKSIFTVLNDRLPLQGVFPMHCSANVGADGKVAVFFGLSGTGKTTLSADPTRALIGDDEHGWGETGVFNFEGGCYAKTIRLSARAEPEIWKAAHSYGTVLENVAIDENGITDLDDASKTENTRAAYKLELIANALPAKRAGHPSTVVFLTADAFGILPPIARLSREQALYFFLSGFTAKLAGTEIGVTEPQPTFSTCFGQPFLPQPPQVYAGLLKTKLDQHGAKVWLVNTGWTGGPFGLGERMPIEATRTMLHAALEGLLSAGEYRTDEVFGFQVPLAVPGVDPQLLDPRATWADPDLYDRKAAELAAMFSANFERFDVDDSIRLAGPHGAA
jgi:phosphoenolpyruvate carboxykinase (ATP)